MKRLQPLALPLEGMHLIEASAGTGKTYTITTLFVRLLVERAVAAERILVVTFTEAATAELQARIRERIATTLRLDEGDDLARALVERVGRDVVRDRLRQALRDFDECAISTIHGFCSRMLSENAFESGVAFDTALEPDEGALYRQIAEDFWVSRVQDMDPYLLRYLAAKREGPASLVRLAREVISQPDRGLVPAAVDAVDAAAAFRERLEHARSLWLDHREEIETLLRDDPGLNRRSYKANSLSKWLAAVDDWFAQDDPAPTDLGFLPRFSPAFLHDKVKGGCAPLVHPCFEAVGALCEIPALFAAQLLALRLDLAAYARAEHRRRKAEAGTHTFDDMLQRLDEAVAGPGGDRLCRAIRGRFSAALIDEFQDTDRTQYRIFSRVYAGTDHPLVIIGDPKQSIYAFRGADIFSYLRAARDARDSSWTLDTNWRSSPRMVAAVNTVFQRRDTPFVFDEIEFGAARAQPESRDRLLAHGEHLPALQVRFVPGEGRVNKKGRLVGDWHRDNVPALVADDIARMLASDTEIDGKRLRASDIAVLVRANKHALWMQDALREHGIPAVLHSEFSVLDSPEAEHMHALLSAVAEPSRAGALRAALATDLFGFSGDGLVDLAADDPRWDRWLRRFGRWRDLWENRGFMRMFRAVLDHRRAGRPVHARLLALDDGDRRMTNLLHLAELLHGAATAQRLGVRGLLRWLRDELAPGAPAAEAAQMRLETDGAAVRLITIHKSKGLEYPVVYCPYLWNKDVRKVDVPFSFHDDEGRAWLDIGSCEADHAAHHDREAMAEGARLLYVALTRAKHLAVVLWGPFNELECSALATLVHGRDGEPPAAMRKRVKALDEAGIRDDLETLAAASNGTIAVGDLDETPAPPYDPVTEPGDDLQALEVRRDLPVGRRTSSFSGLVADQETDGRDHDAGTAATARVAANLASGPPAHLVGFPGGRKAGSCFHAIYEHADFADRSDLHDVTARKLAAFGFDAHRWTDPVAEAIGASLDTDVGGFCLSGLGHRDRLDELEFVFPATGDLVTADQIAAVLRLSDAFPRGYLRRVAGLGFVPLRGFLKGFIDLVFCRDGLWYVVDYKSNRLGDHMASYGDAAMAEEMAHHHYYLQYHLYVVALHRLLRYRLPDYDYDRHFGSALYLFFRGMSPADGPRYGVFRDRPRREVIEALSGLFDDTTNDVEVRP